jgi:hypothetical protein
MAKGLEGGAVSQRADQQMEAIEILMFDSNLSAFSNVYV